MIIFLDKNYSLSVLSSLLKLFFIIALLQGCTNQANNDLEQWTKNNSVQPFDRVEFINDAPTGFPMRWALKLKGNLYQYDWSIVNGTPELDKMRKLLIDQQALNPTEIHLIPLYKISESADKELSDGLKKLGLSGTGNSYIVLSKNACAGTKAVNYFEELFQHKEKYFGNDFSPDAKEKLSAIAFAHSLNSSMTASRACIDEGKVTAYQASLIYTESKRGFWIPAIELKQKILPGLDGQYQTTCGFSPDESAIPDWVRNTCIQQKISEYEKNQGIAISRTENLIGDGISYWFYRRTGLVAFMNNIAFDFTPGKNQKTSDLVSKVQITGAIR